MQLKSQINSLEAELEEQRAQKQRALVENEQLRMELEALHRRNVDNESMQMSFMEAESMQSDGFSDYFDYSLMRCCCSQ